MQSHKLTLILALCLTLLFAQAALADSLVYNGQLAINVTKDALTSGEALTGTFTVKDTELVAFNDAYIVAEIVSGGKTSLSYPTQFDDKGIVVSEQKYPAALPSGGTLTVPFTFTLPKTLPNGTYAVFAYYKTVRTPIVGIPHIFASPIIKEFSISGNDPSTSQEITISRTKTMFSTDTGPIGTPVDAGADVNAQIVIKNLSTVSAPNLTVWAGTCYWDDTSCTSFLPQSTAQVTTSLAAGEEKSVPLTIKAPALPNAYAVRIEVRNAQGTMVALYRNRLIVRGATAGIRKMDITSQPLTSGVPASINVLVGATPDHYTKPTFDNFDTNAWIIAQGKIIFSETHHIDSLPFIEGERAFTYTFTPTDNYDRFTVCAAVTKDAVARDAYCFDVVPLMYVSPLETPRGKIKVDTTLAQGSGELSVHVCGFDINNNPQNLNIQYDVLAQGSSNEIRSAAVQGQLCYDDTTTLPQGKYLLIIDDKVNHAQFNKELILSSVSPVASCSAQKGVLCTQKETCQGTTTIAAEGANVCCLGSCTIIDPLTTTPLPLSPQSQADNQNLIAIGAVLIVLLFIIAMGIIHTTWGEKNASKRK